MKRLMWANVAMACVLVVAASAQQETDAGARTLRARYGRPLHVVRDVRTGSPLRVYGRFTPHRDDVVPGRPVDTARNLIARNSDVLRVTPDRTRHRSTHVSQLRRFGHTRRVEFRQSHNGVPIAGTRAFVTLVEGDDVLAMGAKTFPTPGISTEPAVSQDRAHGIALADHPGYVPSGTELLLVPNDTGAEYSYSLVWDIHIDGGDFRLPKRYTIAADSGAVLAVEDDVEYAAIRGTADFWRVQDAEGYDWDVAPTVPVDEEIMVRIREGSYENGNWGERQVMTPENPTFDFSFLDPAKTWDLLAYRNASEAWVQRRFDSISLGQHNGWVHDDIHLGLDIGGRYESVHLMNTLWQARYIRDFFVQHDSTYDPPPVTITVLGPNAGQNSNASGLNNRINIRPDHTQRADVLAHEWAHLVRYWFYGYTASSVEEKSVSEGMAYYYACRAAADTYYRDAHFDGLNGDSGQLSDNHVTDIDTGADYQGPSRLVSYKRTMADEFVHDINQTNSNGWILATTLWDIVKHNKPPSGGPGSWPPDAGWDDVLWNTWAIFAPQTFDEVHHDMERTAYYWEAPGDADGDGYRDATDWRLHVHSHFYWHGFTATHPWPLTPPLPAPARHNDAGGPGLRLNGNYPNPFNPETWIAFSLEGPAEVTVTIYDLNGTVVRTMGLGALPAGTYGGRESAVHWDGRNARGEAVASGTYVYEVRAGDDGLTRKMVLNK